MPSPPLAASAVVAGRCGGPPALGWPWVAAGGREQACAGRPCSRPRALPMPRSAAPCLSSTSAVAPQAMLPLSAPLTQSLRRAEQRERKPVKWHSVRGGPGCSLRNKICIYVKAYIC